MPPSEQVLVDIVGPVQNRYTALPEPQKQALRGALLAWLQVELAPLGFLATDHAPSHSARTICAGQGPA